MKKPEASIIISFYNNIEALQFILASLEIQSFQNFEAIIADDGSKKEIVDKITLICQHSKLNIKHIWHEDQGWRKNIILNKSIVASESEYLIFIDGDCILHHKFIEEHFRNKKAGIILAGRRVNLSPAVTKKLTSDRIKKKQLQRKFLIRLLIDKLSKKSKNVENGIYFRSQFIRKRINKKAKGLLGSNFSIFKKDILAVNGFDERYKNPFVGEDTDLWYRLEQNGVQLKTVKHLAIQYHLWHEKKSRPQENLDIFNDTKRKKIIFTPFGIKKL